MRKKNKCPCCGYYTINDEPGRFYICPVCYWEDDNIQRDDPNYKGGANDVSLVQARKNFKIFGACSEKFIDSVRKPYIDELPENNEH